MLTVIGSCNIDIIAHADRLPGLGETVLGHGGEISFGGKGANQAVAASRLGSEVNLLACVGNDVFGEQVLKNLKTNGVNIRHMCRSTELTGIALISLSEGDNAILVAQGANADVSIDYITGNHALIAQSDAIVMQLEIPQETMTHVVNFAFERKIPVILNPAPPIRLAPEIIEKLTYLTPNEHEVYEVLGEDSSVPLEDLVARYPKKLIVTLGKEGVLFHNGKEPRHVLAPMVEVVDTTGAGDTFTAAFTSRIEKHEDVDSAVEFAVAASSQSVTRKGAQGGMPALDEILELRRKLFPHAPR